ncbi:MAG TPA: efflux RND transporter periplasmic adaptor subunit [Clostridia bacterium]|nr:efflux RND transporter periplasmic adaptor subunit [Clostridia bacterium]
MRATAACLTAALFLCACHSNKPVPQPPQAVQVQEVQTTSGRGTDARFSALVLPDSQVALAFRVPGYITSLGTVRGQDGSFREIAEGDRVAKGITLARLRPSEYRKKLQQATSQTEAAGAVAQKAKLDFERATRLYASQSITRPEYDAARAQYDATQAQARGAHAQKGEAEIALRDATLNSPISGDIVKKNVEVGSLVGSGTLAFVVANTDRVKVVVGVPDLTVQSLKVGLPVTIAAEALPNRTFDAKISRIASAADPKTRNFDVEVAIPNLRHALKAGMIASLQLATSAPSSATTVVPISAIVQSSKGTYGVFIVAKENGANVARLRTVDVGEVLGSDIEVSRGLEKGDTIVTTGATVLKDGQQVEVLR